GWMEYGGIVLMDLVHMPHSEENMGMSASIRSLSASCPSDPWQVLVFHLQDQMDMDPGKKPYYHPPVPCFLASRHGRFSPSVPRPPPRDGLVVGSDTVEDRSCQW